MPDPTVAAVVKKLLSLDTPVSVRIFEIGLLLGLIICAAYVKSRFTDATVQFAASAIGIFGVLALFLMILVLVLTIFASANREINK